MTVTIGRGAQRPSWKRPVTPAPAVIAEIDHLVARHRAAMMIFATFVRIQHVDEDQHRLIFVFLGEDRWCRSPSAVGLSDGRPIRALQFALNVTCGSPTAIGPLRHAGGQERGLFMGVERKSSAVSQTVAFGRVEMWRGGCRLHISVSASFVWRCLSSSTVTPFPHPAHRTGQANLRIRLSDKTSRLHPRHVVSKRS